MPKTISSSLLTDIQSTVTSMSTCVEITRRDGTVLRYTTHDSDLTFEGSIYRHDVAFQLAAIQSGTQLSVDNTQLSLFCDEVNLFLADFKAGLFEYAAVRIFQVNYLDMTHGNVIMRKGWFGPIDFAENHIVNITITGLLKILDLEVGRIYQPSCDADLGDSRCKVAVQQNQIRSELNPYILGDWVHYYDPALMTALTVVNPGFETDGAIGDATPITGWTKTAGAHFQVRADSGGFGSFSPLAGTYMLVGSAIPNASYESGLFQDIDLSTQIANNTAIDAGKISIFFSAAILSTFSTKNVWRLKVELLNASNAIIDTQDIRYITLDKIDSWRERACVLPLLPGTRKARIWLYLLNGDGTLSGGNAADRIRMYWWNHTLGRPYSDVIHHVTRIAPLDGNQTFYMYNPSFEINGNVANANNPTINAWVTGVGNWWQVVSTAFAGLLPAQDGTKFLLGGDDGGVVSNLYSISQVHPFFVATAINGWGLSQARMLLGKYTCQMLFSVGYGDTLSKATVIVDWLNDALVVQGSLTILNDVTGTTGWHAITSNLGTIPAAATRARVTLQARSPTGSGNAKVAYDNIRFIIVDAERPLATDALTAQGSASTVFNTTIGAFFFDANIVYKPLAALTAYDTVATVTDVRREFTGSTISGATGAYEMGPIRFLSGSNAGLKNIVRKWDKTTAKLKLYFRMPHSIVVGDRFFYAQSCQRRFVEDCMLRFENTLNFRGFPYVPGAAATAQPSSVAPVAPIVFVGLPASGPAAGGTGVLVRGRGMTNVTAVSFGGTPAASFKIVDDNNLQVISPAHAVGAVTVQISGSGPGFSFSVSMGTFTFV